MLTMPDTVHWPFLSHHLSEFKKGQGPHLADEPGPFGAGKSKKLGERSPGENLIWFGRKQGRYKTEKASFLDG